MVSTKEYNYKLYHRCRTEWGNWGKEEERVPNGGIRNLRRWYKRSNKYMDISHRISHRYQKYERNYDLKHAVRWQGKWTSYNGIELLNIPGKVMVR